MAVFLVSDQIKIKSHKGEYSVNFIISALSLLNNDPIKDSIYILDEQVAKIYKTKLNSFFSKSRFLIIKSTEKNKSLEKFPQYIDDLLKQKIRKGQVLIAIGGGVIQDITCFLASTIMRGLPWIFFPTTLLAQSDSCIGSKSSINSGSIKNILGTFKPPDKVFIDINFLKTLKKEDMFSGIGEMLKVHAINSPDSFDKIASDYDKIFGNPTLMKKYIINSLLMKKRLIELDEFDQGPRNVMNYGHSFGHAIESATDYAIPHGIAISIGMDIANFVAVELGISQLDNFNHMHSTLRKNSKAFDHINIDQKLMMNALFKDKKNSFDKLRLVLPDKNRCIGIDYYENNKKFLTIIHKYFKLFR